MDYNGQEMGATPSMMILKEPAASDRPEGPGERVLIGRATRPQALNGWFRVQPEVDDLALFEPGLEIWLETLGESAQRYRIEAARFRHRMVQLKLEGVESVEDAESLRGRLIYVDQDKLPALPKDSFYHYEITGCKAYKPDGAFLGEVKEVQPGASGDLIVIKNGENEILVPAAKEFVRSIDITNRKVVVEPPEVAP